MNIHTMQWLDWAVVWGVLAFFAFMAYRTGKYNRSAADFLAANRKAGRYMLTMAQGMATLGAVTIIGNWERRYNSGFGAAWWSNLAIPVGLFMSLTGWVIYRFRETRALTLAQFLEMRYSRRFRIIAAFVIFTSGLINFGIFPKIGAEFFMKYCALPDYYHVLGFGISTYMTLVAGLVLTALYFTLAGGQIAVLVTDFLQSFFCYIVFGIIIVLLLYKFPLSEIFESLKGAPAGKSMLDPLDAGDKEFNSGYFIISIILMLYGQMAWQGHQAYNSSAKSPHEAKMANIIGGYRMLVITFGLAMIPLVAYMIMHSPQYADQAKMINESLAHIPDESTRMKMLVPATMTLYMPVGLMGAFAAVMMAAFITTNDTYLHSWGSIFIQDIVMPFRKKPMSPKQHMWLLRLAIIGVAIFIFCWSMWVPLNMPIWMYFALTGAIWLGGAGIIIIGGLYSRWGTTASAYAGLFTGTLTGLAGVVCWFWWEDWFGEPFWYNGMQISLIAAIAATIAYMLVALGGRSTRNIKHAVTLGLLAGGALAVSLLVFCADKIQLFGLVHEWQPKHKLFYAFLAGMALYVVVILISPLIRKTHGRAHGLGAMVWALVFLPTLLLAESTVKLPWLFIQQDGFTISQKLLPLGVWAKVLMACGAGVLAFLCGIFLRQRHSFNLERMLHRGKYAIKEDRPQVNKSPGKLIKFLRLDRLTEEFSTWDKVIYGFSVIKGNLMLILVIVMTVLTFTVNLTEDHWMGVHYYLFLFNVVLTMFVIVWLSCGGLRDMFRLFKDLKTASRDDTDDGWVADHDHEEKT